MKKYWQPDWANDGPTQGTASLVDMIRADGRHVVDAGQGAELPLPKGDLRNLLTQQTNVVLGGLYNTKTGGDSFVRESAAHYINSFYRIPVTRDNTFIYQGLGRAGVKLLLEKALAPHRNKNYQPILIMPDLHWPTLSEIANDQGMKVAGYDHANPDLSAAVRDVLDVVNPAHVVAVLLNYPLNPTSRGIDAAQMTAFMTAMDQINSAKGANIHVILDMPYSYACPPGEDEKGRFLKTGVEHVFDKKWKTVVSGIISFSKFLSAAPLGTSILFTFGDARDLSRRLSVGGLGIARNDLYIRSLAKVIDGTHDELLWAHNDALRKKYVLNREALEKAFGERVYPGMPNVLSLVTIPGGEVFGRTVMCCDGEKRVLKNGYDVVEFLANNHGIAVVANGVKDGNLLMRIAQREEYEAFGPGLKSLVAGLQEIRQAPVHKDERILEAARG